MSRVGQRENICFGIVPTRDAERYAVKFPGHYTKNVVYREVLA